MTVEELEAMSDDQIRTEFDAWIKREKFIDIKFTLASLAAGTPVDIMREMMILHYSENIVDPDSLESIFSPSPEPSRLWEAK